MFDSRIKANTQSKRSCNISFLYLYTSHFRFNFSALNYGVASCLMILASTIFIHTDLVKQPDQLEKPGLEESITEEKSDKVDPEIKDPTEAYVRDLLVASGYYDGSCSRPLPKWDPLGQPISNQVFEEVEESYRQITKVDESSTKDEGARTDHRMILHLLNEALPTVLKQPSNMSRLGKAIESSRHQFPRGRKLLSFVWEIIQSHVHPPAADRSTYALESMLARDLKSDLWPRLLDDDVSDLGKDLECHITCDLIEEIVKDIYSLHT